MRKSRRERGFSLVELLIVITVIMILAAIAVPSVIKQIMSAHELAAVAEIQSINKGQLQYYSTYGRYATSLTELGPPASGAEGPAASGILPKVLTDGKKDGYIFIVQGTPAGYQVNANPETFGTSGRRTFYSDQTGAIHQKTTAEPATASSPEIR